MWLFWIAAGLLAAGAAALTTLRAARAARQAGGEAEDPALVIYRRQLTELDELSARGLLGEEEQRAARAEAGRRLLAAADAASGGERAGGRGSRLAVTVAVAAAALAALGLYVRLGSPGMGDQPYRARVQAWRKADPAALSPAQIAAVLRDFTAEHPKDAKAHNFLGLAELAAGDAFAAQRSFEQAIRLGGATADAYAGLARARLALAGGKLTLDVRAAFDRALQLDPKNTGARYYLGRAEIESGDRQAGITLWRGLVAELPADDPNRPALLAELTRMEAPAAAPLPGPETPEGAAIAQAAPPEQAAFIRGMVARLAERLRTNPDDPDGWARLVRSYGVLGDRAAQAQALATARKLFANRPDALAKVEAQAKAAPPR